MEEGSSRRASAAAVLPDELIIEILARLPAKSLCSFSCVSRAWRALISDPANRRRFAQTLSGIFFSRPGSKPPWFFVGLSASPPPGVDTALSFLPPTCGKMELVNSCNGLLLVRCTGARESRSPPFYVVCNPATGEWITLPQPTHAPGLMSNLDTCSAELGFDPAASSNFYVFQLVQEYGRDIVQAVEIYSSETDRWVLRESGWSDDKLIHFTRQMTYFKGFLHLCDMSSAVASVDTEGQTWRFSRVLSDTISGNCISVGSSQRRLLCVYDDAWQNDAMLIYVLEDHDSEERVWTFKHSISKPGLTLRGGWDYYIAAFHPDSDLIFFFDLSQKRLMSYDMKHSDVHVICTLGKVPNIVDGMVFNVRRPFLPYVPLYSGALASPGVN
ncbi:unnamed protein product [Urochloa decumbens]|uniref:F-box domain-containing protein n=1 Tax=Urochloa decumbens TaxID=240449 RepID=A0ABC8WL03_9POAL